MNANTNQMTQAFVKAGIEPPTVANQIWNIIKEQPGVTYSRLKQRAAHLSRGSISSTLNDMEKRSMIYSRPIGDRKNAYFTDMEQYRLLPRPAATKQPTKVPEQPPAAGKLAGEPTATASTQHTTPSVFSVDQLTIAQARALYQQLHKMFGA